MQEFFKFKNIFHLCWTFNKFYKKLNSLFLFKWINIFWMCILFQNCKLFMNMWTYFCIPELFWICRQHVSNWWAFFVVVNIFFNPWFCLKTLTFFYFAKSFSICEHFLIIWTILNLQAFFQFMIFFKILIYDFICIKKTYMYFLDSDS